VSYLFFVSVLLYRNIPIRDLTKGGIFIPNEKLNKKHSGVKDHGSGNNEQGRIESYGSIEAILNISR
jgi:hypothetical protein